MKIILKYFGFVFLLLFYYSGFSAQGHLITPDIVGGDDAPDGPYRWVVKISGCGGSLIAPGWVVTAAHCVDDEDPDNPTVDIVIGRNNLNTNDGYERYATQVIIHPDYDIAASNDSDLALLKLNASVPVIAPLALADSNIMDLVGNPGDIVSVLGYGRLSEGGSSTDQLQIVDVPIVSNSECQDWYGSSTITSNMLCAGLEEGGLDSCQGDSGGPLVVNNFGTYHLAGIVSWGRGCARPGFPGVYTDVENFTDWITAWVNSEAPPPAPCEGCDSDELVKGVPVTGLSGSRDDQFGFTLEVLQGASNLSIMMDGGSGDADLYVRYGSAATTDEYDCRPFTGGNTETCLFDTPQAGTYFILVNGYRSFSDVTLVATYDSIAPIAGSTIQLQNVGRGGYLATAGNDVIHKTSNSGDETFWTLVDAGNGWYHLKNKQTNRYLDHDNERDVDTSSNSSGSDKEWRFVAKDGFHLIENMSSGRNIDADSNGGIDTSNNSDSQKQWIITVANTEPAPEDGSTIQLQNVARDSYLATSGDDVIHQTSDSGDETLWKLDDAGNGAYYLINQKNNKRLDYDSADVVNTSANTGSDKEWKLIPIGDYYLLENVRSGENLDTDGGGVVDMSPYSDLQQQWIITVERARQGAPGRGLKIRVE